MAKISPPSPTKTINVGLGGIAIKPERLRALRGDRVAELAQSMQLNGLLQPIVLRTGKGSGYWLVAGWHRFEAAKLLKWPSIRANIFEGMKADATELAEIDENLVHVDLTPAERAAHQAKRKEIYERLHPETKAGAAQAKGMNAAQGRGRQNGDDVDRYTADAAMKTGKSERSIQREAARGAAIEDVASLAGTSLDKGDELDALTKLPDDERKKLAARAKAGEKVSAKTHAKKINRAERERQLAIKTMALPDKRYGVIFADPPWRFEPYSNDTGMDRAADNHYPTMDVEAIATIKVPAAADCVLFLWATVPMLPQAFEVMRAWGFTYKSNFVWVKDKAGTGFWNKNRHELLLVGTRGSIPAPASGEQFDSVIEAPRGLHSAKPFAAHEMIEVMFPTLPRIELFARERFAGWDAWGNEINEAA